MARAILRNYRLKNGDKIKAVCISFDDMISKNNLSEYQQYLIRLSKIDCDAFIFTLSKSEEFNGYLIKLITAFHNSVLKPVGLLLGRETRDLACAILPNHIFSIGDNERTVLLNLLNFEHDDNGKNR